MQNSFPIKLHPHHVGIFVSDIDRSIKWYEEILWFKLMYKKDHPLGRHGQMSPIAFIKNGDFYIELHVDAERTPFNMDHDTNSLGAHHISLYVKNEGFEPFKAFLKSKNVNIRVECRHSQEQCGKPGGVGVIYINDPDGTPIEIQEEFNPGEY